jgi:hypothetical protein
MYTLDMKTVQGFNTGIKTGPFILRFLKYILPEKCWENNKFFINLHIQQRSNCLMLQKLSKDLLNTSIRRSVLHFIQYKL